MDFQEVYMYQLNTVRANFGLVIIISFFNLSLIKGDSHISSGVISPIHFDRQLGEHASDSLYPSATTLSGVTSTNQPYEVC